MRLRYLIALLPILGAWESLNTWYQFRSPEAYRIFAACFIIAIVLTLPLFQLTERESIGRARTAAISLFCLLLFPCGEWLRLNFPSSRMDWSRQLLTQFIFLYLVFGALNLFPKVVRMVHIRMINILDRLVARKMILALFPLVFFLFSVWIALFVFRSTALVQDSAAYLFQAKIFLAGQISAPAPPVPKFFENTGDMLVIHQSRWASMYQPGFSVLLAAGMLLRSEYVLTSLLGALTVAIWIAYLSRWYSRRVAFVFGLLALLSPFVLLMFSTPLIHGVEAFLCSSLLFVCRSDSEKPSRLKQLAIVVLLFFAVIVRGFSIFAFLFPLFIFGCFFYLRKKSYLFLLCCLLGFVAGASVLFLYQKYAYGDPLVSGYFLEYPGIRYGFGPSYLGQIHTQTRALEQLSNSLLGLNYWLNGWYSGSLFFVICFFLLQPARLERWTKLLLLCCSTLALFYFFSVSQDLIIGPRYYFVMAPVGLFLIAKLFDHPDSESAVRIRVAVALSLLTFLPFRLVHYVKLYQPSNDHRVRILESVEQAPAAKKLIFLSPEADQSLINMNDPFLNSRFIVCRDLQDQNTEAISAFPGYQPVYYRLDENWREPKFAVQFEPRPKNIPPMSTFHLAMAMIAPIKDEDAFDTCYGTVFLPGRSREEFSYLQEKLANPDKKKDHRDQFREGLIHAGIFLLLPKLVFEQYGSQWSETLDVEEMNRQYRLASNGLSRSGPIGQVLYSNLVKIQRRIDQDDNQVFSADELRTFLFEKVQLLQTGE